MKKIVFLIALMFVFAFVAVASAATWHLSKVDGGIFSGGKADYEDGKTYEIAFNPGVYVFGGTWVSSDTAKSALPVGSGDGIVTVVGGNPYSFGIVSYDYSGAKGKVISIDPQGKTGTLQVQVVTASGITPSTTVTLNFVSRKNNENSSGCTAAYAPFALLLAAPLFFFRKKR